MTTVEVVQYVDKFAGVGVDADRIRCHMPQPKKFQGRDKATSLFACLVHYIMRNNFVSLGLVAHTYVMSVRKSSTRSQL